MTALFWQTMSGNDGRVFVKSIGAVVGTMSRWNLKRPEESSPVDPGLLTLRASFSYVNQTLMNEEAVNKTVEITIRKGTVYRVSYERMAFDGATLELQNCRLVSPDAD